MPIELTNEERETMLNMTADDRGTWQVFSDDPVMQGRLERIGAVLVRESGPSKFYALDADQVLLRKGKPKMSDATRAQRAVALAAMRRASDGVKDSGAS